MDNELEDLRAEINILKGIIGKLLVIVNRMMLDDKDENAIRVAAMVVEYPLGEK